MLILDTPIHLGSYSASELAQITDVSNATITRFVRHLGYDSYEEARRQARAERPTLPAPAPAPAAQASANAPNSQALWQAQQDKLRATLAQIPASAMNTLAAALHRAPRVVAWGWGANHAAGPAPVPAAAAPPWTNQHRPNRRPAPRWKRL